MCAGAQSSARTAFRACSADALHAQQPPKGLRRSRHPVPPRAVQGSLPKASSNRSGWSLAQHHTHALLLTAHPCSRSARWPFTPQSPLYSPLKPAVVAREIARTFSQGFGAPCLRAPGLRRPFAPSRPLHPMGCCSPHSAIVPPPKTVDVYSLVDRPAQPRTCTTRIAARRSVHVVHRPIAQARDRAVAPRSPRGAGQQPAGLPKGQRRPPYRAHWSVSAPSSLYRPSMCPDPVKRTGRGRNTMRSPGEVVR